MTSSNFDNNVKKSPCPVTYGFAKDGKVRPVYCKKWTCTDCARRNARKWARRVKAHIAIDISERGASWWMITLTMGSKFKDPADAYRAIPQLWARLRQYVRRENRGHWTYTAFIEGQPQRRSMPHFHILTPTLPRGCYGARGKPTKHAAHRFAFAFGWGYQADVQPVSSERAANYVTKYVSKGAGSVPKGFRRVRVSQDIKPVEKPDNFGLVVMRTDETFIDFIDRASIATGLSHETLVGRWMERKFKEGAE